MTKDQQALLDYIEAMSLELCELAAHCDRPVLAYILQVAAIEAREAQKAESDVGSRSINSSKAG